MASITITIPDDKVSDVLDAFAWRYGWDQDSGYTKGQFARYQINQFLKGTYIQWRVQEAKRTAESTTATQAASDIGGVTTT